MENKKHNIFEQGGNISQKDLLEIFTIQYNDLFSKLLKKTNEEFISLLKRQIILHLRITDKQCDSTLLTNFYEKYQDISRIDKLRIKKIYEELKRYHEKKLTYLNILDIYVHCYKCKEAIHICGNKLIIFENLFFCLKCQRVYNPSQIKLFCKECNKTYITSKRTLSEKKCGYLYSISYAKYHCFTENEEKIKCLNCGNDLYYNINLKSNSKGQKGIRDIFCIKCKLIFDTKEVFFNCKICGQNFKADPQIYRNFPSIKKYLLLLVHTFRKNVYALPDIITNKKCNCDLDGVQYFLHKDNGRLYEGNKNGKNVIICDHCYGIFKNENFNWNCPLCGGTFKAVKKFKNMRFDKNKKKISATNVNTNIQILNINNEEKNNKEDEKDIFNISSNNHTFYNSIAYSNEKINNYESSKQLTRDLSLSNRKNINLYDSQDKLNRIDIYNSDKKFVIKIDENKKNKTTVKKSGSRRINLTTKYKHIKPNQLFKNTDNKIHINNNNNKNSTLINNNSESKRSLSYLNKNYNIKDINDINDLDDSNSQRKNKPKNRAISSFKKVMISDSKPLFNIKESICEESLEGASSEKKNFKKIDKKLENVIPKNLFVNNKNNNCNNNNISISINNNVIQLRCSPSPNLNDENYLQKNKNKKLNNNISPEIKILDNSSSNKKIVSDNDDQNILINSSKEIYKKKKIGDCGEMKENKIKGKSAQKSNHELFRSNDVNDINNNIENNNDEYSIQSINNNKKIKKVKKVIHIKNKDEIKNKNEIINKKLVKNESKKVIKKKINKNIIINNTDTKIIKTIQSEKKPNLITKLNLANIEENNLENTELKIKKISKNRIKIKKISDTQINKPKNIKISNSGKNSNPNVFIITNLSKRNTNNENSLINNNIQEKSNFLNIITDDNNNFVYNNLKNIKKNKKNNNNNKMIPNNNKKENILENFIYSNRINKQNINGINPYKNIVKEIIDNKIENGIHKKNNFSFHINSTNKIKNFNSNETLNDDINNNNKKKEDNNQINNKNNNNINNSPKLKKQRKIPFKNNKNINNKIINNDNYITYNNIDNNMNNKINNNIYLNLRNSANDNPINKNIKMNKIINIDTKANINNIIKNNYHTNNHDKKNDPDINNNISRQNENLISNNNNNESPIKNLLDDINNDINNKINIFENLKIYFSSYEQEVAQKLKGRYSFDIRKSKNHFSLLNNSDNFEIKTFDSNYYTILRQIGKGSYGKIYLVEDPNTKEQFALKKIIIGDALELKENQNEYKLTWKLTKLNPELKIVKKYAIETKKLDKYNLVMYVLMEVANCDWEQELINRQKDNAFYSEIELIEILKSLVNTLAELQKKGISHRDVKPQNILCFGKDGYKLSDFGEAKTKKRNYIKSNNFEENTRKQTVRGTELYMSPILFKALQMNAVDGAQYNAYKSDVFSLGMCFLLASCLNYQSLYDIREVYDMEVLKEIVEKYLKNYSNNYINLILNMLQINEKLRPDFIELNSMII